MIKNTDSISIKKRKNLLNEIDSMHPVDKKIALRKFEFENQTSSQSDNFKNIQGRVDSINVAFDSGNTKTSDALIEIEKQNGTLGEIEEHINPNALALGSGMIGDVLAGGKKAAIKQTTKKRVKPKPVEENQEEVNLINETGRVVGDIFDETINNVLETGDDLAQFIGLPMSGIVYDSNDFFGTVRWVDNDEMMYLKEDGRVSPRIVNIADKPKTGGGQIISGIGQFVASMAVIFRATRGWKANTLQPSEGSRARKILTNNPFKKGEQIELVAGRTHLQEMFRLYGAAAFADFLFSPNKGNISTIFRDAGVDNMVVNYFDSSPENEEQYLKDIKAKMMGRLKNVQEGLAFGRLIDTVIDTLSVIKLGIKRGGEEGNLLKETIDKYTDFGRTKKLDETQGGSALSLEQAKSEPTQVVGAREQAQRETPFDMVSGVTKPTDIQLNNMKNITKDDVTNKIYNSAASLENVAYFAQQAEKKTRKILADNMSANNKTPFVDIKFRKKDIDSLTEKLQSKNNKGSSISDYLGFRFITEEKDIGKGRKFVVDNFTVLDKEVKKNTGVTHYQVLDDSGKFTYEIQVVSDNAAAVLSREHKDAFAPYKMLQRKGLATPSDDAYMKRETVKLEKNLKDIDKKEKETFLQGIEVTP